MAKKLGIIQIIITPLIFNKTNLKIFGKDEKNTSLAILIILITSILKGITSINQGFDIPGLDTSELDNAISKFLIGFLFQLMLLFIASAVIGFVFRIFGGKITSGGVLRIIGITNIWLLIDSLMAIIGFFAIGYTIQILWFICLIIGLSAASGKNIIISIIALLIGLMLSGMVTIFLFIIVVLALVVSILALLSI